MCALMGSSGAGKSTLLDLIADRKNVGKWSGEIMINRRHRSRYFNRESAYVLQDDVHIATLTVEETLKYAAWCRMVEGTSERQMQERVDYLLETIGLTHVRMSKVGDQFTKGISGGQLKRLSIAVEIVALPGLIFLDEPTSGLDSSIALEVMGAVRKLANQGRTVVSTIHQPSPEVYALFHKVVLLSAGRLIFCGGAMEAVKHFSQPSMGYHMEEDQNPAEFIISVCGGEIFPEDYDRPRTPEELEQMYKSSPYFQQPADPLDFVNVPRALVVHTRRHATNKYTAFKMIFHRAWLSQMRDVFGRVAELIKNLAVGIIVGIVFYNQGDIKPPFYVYGVPIAGVQNVNALLFFAMLYCLLTNTLAITTLCGMNTIYRRELASYAYACSPYWAAQCLVPIPILVVNHAVFMCLVYFICTLPAQQFFFCFLILLLVTIISFYIAMLLAAMVTDAQFAMSIFPDIMVVLTMFSGFQISLNDIPKMWIWAPYISPARWCFEGIAVNEWEQFDVTDDITPGGGNGMTVIQNLGFQNFKKENSVWILILMIMALQGMVYIAMRPTISLIVFADREKDEFAAPANGYLDVESGKGTAAMAARKKSMRQQMSMALTRQNKGPVEVIDHQPEDYGTRKTFDVTYYKSNTSQMNHNTTGCRLAFRHILYDVPDPADRRKQKRLLNDVSGEIVPGEMCALMGASGAGKSTLLDVIAGRKTVGTIQGDILFNGSPRTPSIMLQTAYVMQDNVHIGTLTVKETLMYAAHFRMSQYLPLAQKEKRVFEVMKMLGLQDHGDTIVGTEFRRGLSGGQVKRLSIGVEIVHLPDLIFLDEPTTGLDSAISHDVMSAVKNLTNQNRTVVCTIHQPSARTYALFDKLLLLSYGRVIYFGDAAGIVDYFQNSIYRFPYEPKSNVADYLIAVAGSFLASGDGTKIPGSELADYYSNTDMNKEFMAQIERVVPLRRQGNSKASVRVDYMDLYRNEKSVSLAADNNSSNNNDSEMEYPTTTLFQTYVLCHRVFMKSIKDPELIILAFVKHMVLALFYGSLYWKLSTGTQATAYSNRISLLFFTTMFVIGWHQQNIPALFQSRLQFYRERSSKLYGAIPFWFSSFYLDIPIESFLVFVFSVILYNMTELSTYGGSYGIFFWELLLTSWTGLFFAQAVAAFSPTQIVAVATYPIFLFVNITFSGYIVYLPSFPAYLSTWGPYTSFMRFTFQTLVLNELENNSKNLPYAPQYIESLGFDVLKKSQTAPILILFLFFYAALVLIGLRFISFEKR